MAENLGWLPALFLYVALAAWTAAFVGLVRQFARRLLPAHAERA